MKHISRWAAAAVATGLAGTIGFAVTSPAGALDQKDKALTVHENESVHQEYGPIAAANAALGHSPATCRTRPYCDTIPLTVIVPPGVGEDDEYFVFVTLEWETQTAPGPTGTLNDLDMYIYTETTNADGTVTATEIGGSASAREPEKATLFRPSGGQTFIVVNNFNGVNTGYRLTAEYRNEALSTPFEAIEQSGRRGTTRDNSAEVAPPVDRSGDSEPLPGPAFDPTSGLLEPVPVSPDSDFAAFDVGATDDAGTPNELAASLLDRRTRRTGPPRPVSGVSILLWMVALPGALGAAALRWMLSRRPAALVSG